jgi:pimeloyl-ACP methyl ester carboxylesterase
MTIRRKMLSGVKWLAFALLSLIVVALVGTSVASWLRENTNAQVAAPSTGHFAVVNGEHIFYQEQGPTTGPTVVFIGGTMAWGEIWRETLDAVSAAGFHTITIDLPPFGYSDRSDEFGYGPANQAKRILGVIDALNLQHVTLVGHSFGGGATVEAAFTQPEKIQSLVLVDAALGLDAKDAGGGILNTLLSIRPVRNAVVSFIFTNPPMLSYGVKINYFDTAKATDKIITTFKKPLNVTGTSNAVGDWWFRDLMVLHSDAKYHDKENYKKFQPNVLVLWGREDTTTPLQQGDDIAKLFPHSELSILDHVSHVPHLEAPGEFNTRLQKFLNANR